MYQIIRCDNSNSDFQNLVVELDKELAVRDGEDHAFYDQYNKIDSIRHCVVLYEEDIPVACGAMKYFDENIFEIKRMYTVLKYRGKGLAGKVLSELEGWAQELFVQKCILETGVNQPEAIALYQRLGYHRIPNYGQYKDVDSSFCFQKFLK
ncbi:GNAT family N-acetyltransferase [Namhaeicola litoreus]|uniref:GNAT family N-acetyltransferase n=1 Tax=Namhaeicola litoreus TaxID=1052145 RepID=A0ABW3XY02_9FLAO